MEHARLIEALRKPETYPHTVGDIRVLQTHISSVFLTGDFAYKLKKPVDFGFLDFSTVELRERYCRAEVELNRRLAPEEYLSVEPLTLAGGEAMVGGEGQVVDWLVKMRQLDDDELGVAVLERGELDEHNMDQLVGLLVPFYSSARTGGGVDQHGTTQAVRFNTDENFAQTDAYVGKLISRERYTHIRDWTNKFYEEQTDLFSRRVDEGRIRESHGDLHLDNIFFSDPPVIFDCIEFSDRLRCGDVACDVAFLAMDLDFRGRGDLGAHFIERFVEQSGDEELPALLDFYKCYRAYVRGKIASFTSVDPGLTEAEKRQQRNLARRYFGLAHRYAGGSERPSLVVLYGLMGTGKTSVAQYLREAHGWHWISTDAVRKQIAGVGEATRVYVPYNEGLYSPEMNRRTYEEVCRRAENLLEAGLPVAIDGAYKNRSERQTVIEMAERTRARLCFLETVCGPQTQRERLASRQVHDTRSDGRIELMERQRIDFDPSGPDEAHLMDQLSTEGPKRETRRRLLDRLCEKGLLERHDIDEPN